MMKPSEMLRVAGKPIAYYPELAKPLGGVNASILFSHFFYWHDKTRHELGIYRTAEEIEIETGLGSDAGGTFTIAFPVTFWSVAVPSKYGLVETFPVPCAS